MNIKLCVAIGAIVVGSCAWAQEDTSHYVITLDSWDYPQEFTVTPNAMLPSGLVDYPCYPAGDICGDPFIKISNGGGSTLESGSFTFTADGDGDYPFENTSGVTYTTMEVSTDLTANEETELFTCSGGNIYQDCGFVNDSFQVYFWDPYSAGITSGTAVTTPEPSQWVILLLACAGIVLARSRRRSFN